VSRFLEVYSDKAPSHRVISLNGSGNHCLREPPGVVQQRARGRQLLDEIA
jgi:hypothetical protein